MTDMTEAEAWAQLQPLRRAILDEMVKPVQMTALGLDELVDRVTIAVSRYMAGIVPATAEQARRIADEMDRQDGTAQRCRTLDRVMDGTNTGDSHDTCRPENCDRAPKASGSTCWDCGASVTETKHGRATLHRVGCQYPGERGPQL